MRVTPSRDDEATARIRAAADRTVELDPDIYRARLQIAALELDILFYQDIGISRQSMENLLAYGMFQINSYALLIAVDKLKSSAPGFISRARVSRLPRSTNRRLW